MVELDERTRPALSYIRHQASKSLSDVRALAQRTAAKYGRCLQDISEAQARLKPGHEWSIKKVLDPLIYATTSQVIESIRDLSDGKVPRPLTADSSGRRSTQSVQELRDEMARLLEQVVVLVGALPDGALPPGIWQQESDHRAGIVFGSGPPDQRLARRPRFWRRTGVLEVRSAGDGAPMNAASQVPAGSIG